MYYPDPNRRYNDGMIAVFVGIPLFFIGIMIIQGCECQAHNVAPNGYITVNGKDYPIPDGSFSLTVQNGEVNLQPELKESKQFLTKIIDVDFVGNDFKPYLARIITCEYENSRHYARTEAPFKEVPYPNEEWLAHLDENGEVVFDSLAQ